MKVKILEKDERKIKFLLEDANPQFANALRRITMVEIPNLAVITADFTINESVLYDEVIAHRLALVPLVFNPKNFEFKDICKCEGKGCSMCEVVFAINKKTPGMIYTRDMKSSNPDVKPLYDNIPIVELKEGQALKLTATAALGTGRDHAKYNTAVSFYRYYPNVKLEGQVKNPEECIKVCPKKALDIKGNKATVTEDCDLCQECTNIADPRVLKVYGDDTKFIFSVESISGLAAQDIIMQALAILNKKAKELEKGIKKLK